jgi:hypothetical protein
MKTLATLLLAATTIATVSLPADAGWRGRRDTAIGIGIGLGVLGGVLGGGAIAAPPPAYGYGPGYGYEPPCYWTRGEPVWNGYRWVRTRVQVCD